MTALTIPIQTPANIASSKVLVDGEELAQEVLVAGFYVQKEVNRIASARLLIRDGDITIEDFVQSAGDLFVPGKEIELQAGYDFDEQTIFKGIIIGHNLYIAEGSQSELVLDLRDISIKMTVGRHCRYFDEDATDSDIMETILSDYDVTPDVESTSVAHKSMVQYYVSDWDFLMHRADANGMIVLTDDGNLSVKVPDMSASPVGTFQYGRDIISFEGGMDAREQYTGVTARTWSYTKQEVVEVEGADPGVDPSGNITTSDLSDVIGLASYDQVHSGTVPDEELQAWADSRLLRSRLAKVRGKLTVRGVPEIKPGDVIELAGLGDRINGLVYVSGIAHEIAPDEIWTTEITFGLSKECFAHQYQNILEKPASALLPGTMGIQQGIVTNIHEDPDGEGRIRVRIPVIDPESDGVWARLSVSDGGLNDSDGPRGLHFIPEVGDEVVVAFFNDDPRNPVILGCLHSSGNPAPAEATEDNFEKGIITRGELKLWFDDDKKVISIETPNANTLTISDDEGGILLEDENGNKVTLNADGITLESAKDLILSAPSGDVKVEGVNIELAAQAQLKGEGSGGAEISSSASTVVKGSIVQIN